jgi:hypothetical protein
MRAATEPKESGGAPAATLPLSTCTTIPVASIKLKSNWDFTRGSIGSLKFGWDFSRVQRKGSAVVLPAWDGSKSGFGRRNIGDLGPVQASKASGLAGLYSMSETGTGRAPAGTTTSFPT